MKKYPHEEYQIIWNNVKPKFLHKKVWYRGYDKKQLIDSTICLDSFRVRVRYFTSGGFLGRPYQDGWKISIEDSKILAQQEISSKLTINQVEKEALKFLTEFLDYE